MCNLERCIAELRLKLKVTKSRRCCCTLNCLLYDFNESFLSLPSFFFHNHKYHRYHKRLLHRRHHHSRLSTPKATRTTKTAAASTTICLIQSLLPDAPQLFLLSGLNSSCSPLIKSTCGRRKQKRMLCAGNWCVCGWLPCFMCDAVSAWDARLLFHILARFCLLICILIVFRRWRVWLRIRQQRPGACCSCVLMHHTRQSSQRAQPRAAHRGLLPRLWWSIGACGRQL